MVRCGVVLFGLLASFLPQTGTAWDWCGTTRVTPGEVRVNYMVVNSRIRSYSLYVPHTHGPNDPLILDFHGFGSNRIVEQQSSCWKEIGDREGAVVVYPQGDGAIPAWNAGDYCCDPAAGDDAAFALQLTQCLTNLNFRQKGLFVDAKQIYAVGLSNGGAMAGRLACEYSDVFAGAAVTSQSFPFQTSRQCRALNQSGLRQRAVPIIESRGVADVIVPYAFSWGWSVPATDSLQRWGQSMGCRGEPVVEDLCDRPGSGPACRYGVSQCNTYYECDNDSVISQCALNDGHLVYGNQQDFNVCDEAWSEFERYRLRQR